MAAVVPPDLELWLTDHLRGLLPSTVRVSNKEPAGPDAFPAMLVVVRDDSGPKLSAVSFQRQVGFSVIAGSRTRDKQAGDLARLVYSIVTDPGLALIDSGPIAFVDDESVNGPYSVPETQDRARKYMTVGYTVTA